MPVADRRCEDQDVGLADRFQNFGTIDPECAPAAQFCFAGIATLATTKIQIVFEGSYFCPELLCCGADTSRSQGLLIKMQVRRPIQKMS